MFSETEYSADYAFAYPTKVITPAPDPDNSGHGTNEGSFATATGLQVLLTTFLGMWSEILGSGLRFCDFLTSYIISRVWRGSGELRLREGFITLSCGAMTGGTCFIFPKTI